MLLHESGQFIRIHGIRLDHHKSTSMSSGSKLLRKNRIQVRKDDSVKAVIFVKLLSDD